MPAPPQVEVTLPPAFATLFPGCPRQTRVTAATVAAAIAALDRTWPGLQSRLCDPTPALRPHLRLYVRGAPAHLATPLADGDELFILTAISGG